MPEFVLNRNYTLSTLFGHVLSFKKGQPRHVPPSCVAAVLAIGAESTEGPVDMLGDGFVEEVVMPQEERNENIFAAFKLLEERAGREDFTASGSPTQTALVKILGFDVAKKEYDPLWVQYLAEKDETE